MAKRNIAWQQVSLRKKVLIWSVAILMIFALTITTAIGASMLTTSEFDLLLKDNVVCYELQAAIEAERSAFDNYVRENSQENLQNYELACAATEQCIAALPFDYAEIGQERYARTWNIIHGYAGYREARDAFIASTPTESGYVDRMYRIMDMQDYLSVYALRLVQATLEQSDESYRTIADVNHRLPLFFTFLLAVAVGVVVYIMRLLAASMVRPLFRLAAESRRIAENDFSAPDLPVERDDEVGGLIRAFNRMKHAMRVHLDTLGALHRKEMANLELEKNLDRTRLEMLKSQVNPHFLFNTLNMISCMARLEDAGDTSRMTLSLANVFRYNLRTKEQEVHLSQELDALEDYIYIQLLRYDSRVTVRKRIQVDPESVIIPAFTLQPVVENAFVHGMAEKEEGGVITLRIWKSGDNVIVSIADNGRGMTPEALDALHEKIHTSEQTGRGIGLGNISRRIAMLYRGGSMKIYSKPGRGTIIQFTIPQNKERDHHV